jgi:hypothetical protein
MRLRDEQNAGSTAFSVVVFALGRCAIVLGGWLGGVEPAVFGFGLLAYVFISGPLLVVSLCDLTPRTRHRSFRPTPPEYMAGRRVKRRLRLVAYAGYIVALAAVALAIVGHLWVRYRFELWPTDGLWEPVISFGIPLAAFCLTLIAFRWLSVKFGWMTPEESRSFPFPRHRWPESWLEPLDREGPS